MSEQKQREQPRWQRKQQPNYHEIVLASLLSYKTTLLRWLKPLQSQRHPSKSRL